LANTFLKVRQETLCFGMAFALLRVFIRAAMQ